MATAAAAVEMAEVGVAEGSDEAPDQEFVSAAEGHDRTAHGDVGTFDPSKAREVMERVNVLTMEPSKVKKMNNAQYHRGQRLMTTLACELDAKLVDASKIMQAYVGAPDLLSDGLIAAAENSVAIDEMKGRQVRWDEKVDEYMGRCKLTGYLDGTEEQKKVIDKLREKRQKEMPHRRDLCPVVVAITKFSNEWTPNTNGDQERRFARPTRLDEGNKQLEALAGTLTTCLEKRVVPGLIKRKAMCLGQYRDWCEFYNEQIMAQMAAIAAGLRTYCPEVTAEIAKNWLRGKYTETEAGRCGKHVWRLMAVTYTYKFYDFDYKDPKRLDKNGQPLRLWSLEHIDPSSETVAHCDRGIVQNLTSNNLYGFGVLPDALNNTDLMKDGSGSLIKLAFWGTWIVNRAQQTKQSQFKRVAHAASIEIVRQIKNDELEYVPEEFKPEDPSKIMTFMSERGKRESKLTTVAANSSIKSMLEKMQHRKADDSGTETPDTANTGGASAATAPRETSDTEEEEEEDEEDEEDEDGAHTPPGPPPPGKRGASPAPKTPAAKKAKGGEEEAEDAKTTSKIAGVTWFKQTNKWQVETTKRGIHPKNDKGEYTVWTNEKRKHVGHYASKAEAEAVYAPEQEERGRQWCAEVEATKDLPYLPWCVKNIEKPTDWEEKKQYAQVYFGDRSGAVGPQVVTITKNRPYTDKDVGGGDQDDVSSDEEEEEEKEENPTSNVRGVTYHKQKRKWQVHSLKHGILPKNAEGEWSVWTNQKEKHLKYFNSKAAAEALNALEQEARGRQWSSEVEATKNLPYFPCCLKKVQPPADWAFGKKYATIAFVDAEGLVGPKVVTICKHGFYTNKNGVKRPKWRTVVSRRLKTP